jgi:hypothetical protein
LWQLQVHFDGIISAFKSHVVLYEDELKVFLEQEMDKIPYFENLSIATKNELIYSMVREERQAGSMLCKKG